MLSSLDVVIVSYRCRELLRDCLISLQNHPPRQPMDVIVVDNASDDGTVEMVTAEFPNVHLIASARNLGFSAANNRAARQGDSTYVLALNPDTRVTAGALERLLELMDSRAEVGICGCRLELEDGSFDHAARRSFPTVLGSLGHFTGIGRRQDTGRLAQYRAPDVDAGAVEAVNGAFMLMRRSVLEEIGYFDEGFWLYMEDLDLCFRCQQAGYLVWYEPSVTVIHVKHGTTGRHRGPRADYAFHYGMYRFYRKHYAPHRRLPVNTVVYVGIAAKLGVSLIRNAIGRRLPSAAPH